MQCTEPCENCGDGKIMENYVLKYTTSPSIYVFYVGANSLSLKFKADLTGSMLNSMLPEDETELAEFREIARRNGDTAYYRPISTCFPYTCLADEAGRFNISCDRDYAGYSAGSSLNDLCSIQFYSAMDFVAGGYSGSDKIEQYSLPLTEFNQGKHYLVSGSKIEFLLPLESEISGKYWFYFTYSDGSEESEHSIMFIAK